jgi:hypothetical protein
MALLMNFEGSILGPRLALLPPPKRPDDLPPPNLDDLDPELADLEPEKDLLAPLLLNLVVCMAFLKITPGHYKLKLGAGWSREFLDKAKCNFLA